MSWAKDASDAIRGQWISHPKFRQAESQTLAALITADPGEVVVVVGPSRVGKSSLVERLQRALVGTSVTEGSMPLVSIILENSSVHGSLSSKSFTVSALQAVRHPMFGLDAPDDLWGIERMRKIERTPEGVLRTAFENALRYRGTKYVFIDEAHHLLYARGGIESAAALLDSLKCLAANARVVLVLVGAYPLLALVQRLPHLIGRKLQTHFGRYRADTKDDVLAFDRILLEYSTHLRLERESLRPWNEYLFQGSLGCIGLLRGWIRNALNQAWLGDARFLSLEHLEASKNSELDLRSLTAEIDAGENNLSKADPVTGSSSVGEHSGTRAAKRSSKPFTANPRRFAVGEQRSTHGK